MAAMETAAVERVLQRLAADGSVERKLVLPGEAIEIGRTAAGLACPDDVDMADLHAQVSVKDGTVVVSDSGEGSGV